MRQSCTLFGHEKSQSGMPFICAERVFVKRGLLNQFSCFLSYYLVSDFGIEVTIFRLNERGPAETT